MHAMTWDPIRVVVVETEAAALAHAPGCGHTLTFGLKLVGIER